jgi:predicted amidohydrolase
MKLAMVQMSVSSDIEENLAKTLNYMEQAAKAGAEFIFFPEVQLSPFFPQYEKRDATPWLMQPEGKEVQAIKAKCKELGIYASPNVYLELNGQRYDSSLVIDSQGQLLGISKMVHIAQAQYFYEQDYYTPSDDGFKVYDTPFGKVGVVICFDRHLPDGIRSCASQGAQLVIIPTANIQGEPMELFQWEVQVQAFQNTCCVAMCNRVGAEGALTFAGESLLAGPKGELLYKTDDKEQLIVVDVPMDYAAAEQKARPWLTL